MGKIVVHDAVLQFWLKLIGEAPLRRAVEPEFGLTSLVQFTPKFPVGVGRFGKECHSGLIKTRCGMLTTHSLCISHFWLDSCYLGKNPGSSRLLLPLHPSSSSGIWLFGLVVKSWLRADCNTVCRSYQHASPSLQWTSLEGVLAMKEVNAEVSDGPVVKIVGQGWLQHDEAYWQCIPLLPVD